MEFYEGRIINPEDAMNEATRIKEKVPEHGEATKEDYEKANVEINKENIDKIMDLLEENNFTKLFMKDFDANSPESLYKSLNAVDCDFDIFMKRLQDGARTQKNSVSVLQGHTREGEKAAWHDGWLSQIDYLLKTEYPDMGDEEREKIKEDSLKLPEFQGVTYDHGVKIVNVLVGKYADKFPDYDWDSIKEDLFFGATRFTADEKGKTTGEINLDKFRKTE
jgi:nitrogen regulatory protein PII-like uncharacterized protein